ncbi:MAG: SusC/RagA family TonB-linked outer membrane protein [Bacteroidetes bacterium HGW-Bacteroidetes-17]|nr:MAG: SusC/RagA family TonB-linked outer membrane protein [Bacteroidetes bacterium HGW-Bacteroidetes-17]
MKRTLSILLLFFLGMQIIFAQGKAITGKVTSASDGSTIPGVQVIVKGTITGTTTNTDGTYSLTVPASATILQFSFIGMKTVDVEIGNQTVINLAMEEDLLQLDEVIVVAYGSAKKGAFTGSATQINAEKIESRPITNISRAIEGQSAGVEVTAGSGQPGASQDIRVRGFGSVSAEQAPLYVVDGVPFEGSLNSLNPNDIESLTILKDAASTSLYGNRAANGVVMITTKKGRQGEGQLTIDVSHGFVNRSQPEYEMMGPQDYVETMFEAYRNGLLSSGKSLEVANQTASTGLFNGNHLRVNPYTTPADQTVGLDGKLNSSARLLWPDDLDWLGAIEKPGTRDNYDISYSGGTKKTDYFVSLSYLNEQGWILESDFKRFSGRANINFQATNWLKTGFNVSASNTKTNFAQTGSSTTYVNPIRFTRQMGPIYPIHQHDYTTGAYILDDNGDPIFDIQDNRPSGASTGRHIVAEILWDSDLDEITSINGKTYAEVKIMKDLTFSTNVSWDQRQYFNAFFNNPFVGDGAPGGRSYRTYTNSTTVNFNQLLNYNKTIGKHNFSVLAGHESYDYHYKRLTGSMTTQVMEGNIELDNFVNINGVGGRTDDYRLESYFSRVNYDYDDKYYLSASIRRDGSSRFYEENRWGDFWSVGGSWRIDQEPFVKDINWIQMLKLRGSYGQTGTDRGIGYYAYQALYDLGWNNQTAAGIYQASLPAYDLVWESNNAFDLALEFGIYNKLFGTIEYYNKASEDLIFEVPLPYSLGMDSKDANIGKLVNKGVELSLNYEVMRTNDFSWNVNFNLSTNVNKFTKLPQEEIIDGTKKYMVGKGLFDFWLKEWLGVNPDNGDAMYRADDVNGPDVYVKGGDTITPHNNNARYHYAGTARPDFWGAISNTFKYKNFEVGFMFTYQVGGLINDGNYASTLNVDSYGSGLSLDMLNRWKNTGDVTDIPRIDDTKGTDLEGGSSDRYLTDASFLALKQFTISYNLPKSFLNKYGIAAARAYCSGENLFYINARKGMNMQQAFSGNTSNAFTPSRVITLGLNVKF